MKSRMVVVTWQHPLKCNGVITHYNICQHGHLSLNTSRNVTNCTVTHLRPYTAYRFQVEACTSKGCSLSPESQVVWTLPDAPEGIPCLELFSDTPASDYILATPQAPQRLGGECHNWEKSFRKRNPHPGDSPKETSPWGLLTRLQLLARGRNMNTGYSRALSTEVWTAVLGWQWPWDPPDLLGSSRPQCKCWDPAQPRWGSDRLPPSQA